MCIAAACFRCVCLLPIYSVCMCVVAALLVGVSAHISAYIPMWPRRSRSSECRSYPTFHGIQMHILRRCSSALTHYMIINYLWNALFVVVNIATFAVIDISTLVTLTCRDDISTPTGTSLDHRTYVYKCIQRRSSIFIFIYIYILYYIIVDIVLSFIQLYYIRYCIIIYSIKRFSWNIHIYIYK